MSTPSECPDLATLLSAVDGDLPDDAYREVAGHLQDCEPCRNRLHAIDETVVMGRAVAAWASSAETERFTRFQARLSEEQNADVRRRRAWNRVAVPAALMAAASLAGIAVVGAPTTSDALRADDLLRRAIASEQSVSASPRQAVRISLVPLSLPGILAGREEDHVRAVSTRSDGTIVDGHLRDGDDLVALTSERLEQAGVDVHRPLSAAAFGAWRSKAGERARRDQVTVTADVLVLRTAVATGSIRAGELRVDRVSYRVVGQTWTLNGVGRVEGRLLAGAEALHAFESADRGDGPLRASGDARADDALERLELDTRLVVSAVNPDGTVRISRQGSRVLVTGMLASAAKRQAIMDQLRARPGVEVSLRSRPIRPEAAAGGLETWTERTFGDTHARRIFAKSLREAAEAVERRVAGLETLARRYPASAERELSPDAHEKLRALVSREHTALISDLLVLDARLRQLGLGTRGKLAPPPSSPSAEWRAQAARMLPAASGLRAGVDELLLHSDIPADAGSVTRKFSDVWTLLVSGRLPR